MYLSLSDEQMLLREAADGALSRPDTLEAARAALDGADRLGLWELAVDAGWPGLLVAEEDDGAGLGAYEALLVLESCGRRLADCGLLGHLPATLLLRDAALTSGEKRAALVRGDDVVELVLDAPEADVLVVVGAGGSVGWCEASAATVTPVESYDATRSVATVDLTGVELTPLQGDGERAAALQDALIAAESVGAAQALLDLTREYAVDRMAFGRAIGSYQAIKFKLVEMLRRIEGARSLLVTAGRAWDGDDPAAFALAARAARVSATSALDYCAPEAIFIHGGVGATWEHDCSLFYRRAELSRRLAGGIEETAVQVADALLAGTTV